ncbi:cytochrome P450 6A1 [Musca domestica]|nr:cytochrome P450 6A1 [Musca domestica]AAA29293.1 CYP6A1 protein [Musca domestica]AAA72423.1 122E8 [Musca domestica]
MDFGSFLLYALGVLASLALYFVRWNFGYWKRRGIPHEEPHLVMGNVKGLRSKYHIGEIIADYYRKFKGSGPFAGIFLGHKPAAVVLDKELRKRVLIKDFSNFANRGLYYNEKDDPLTGHLVMVEGEKWRSLRTKLSPTFTAGKMKYMYNTVLEVGQRLLEVMYEKLEVSSELDMRDILARFNTDVIGSVAFGIECNSLRNPHDRFLAMGRKSIEVPRHNALIMAFIDSFPELSRKLGMRVLPEDVHQFFMSSIKETVDYREKNNIRRNDFLDLVLDLKNNPESISKLGGLTFNELAAQVFVFFLGGFETSSSTMGFALYELAQNQQLQDRLREEVNEVFDQFKEDNISYDALMNIPYLDQVLNETLRKYPVGSALTRQTLNDYVVPHNPKYVLPKGTLVFIPVLGIHYDPELYPNPEEFDPERFSPEMVKQRDSVDWLGFGDGPRNCIGMRFGKMQSRLGLALVIRHFRFTVCSRTDIPMQINPESLAWTPKNNLYLNVQAIRKKIK